MAALSLILSAGAIAKLTGLIEKVDSVLGNGSAFARDPDTGPG
jgi:ATP-binding cassette subfamily F protein 3